MSSPARKRKERLARKRTKQQKEVVAWNRRQCRETQIINSDYVPKDLIDITPNRLIGEYK